jgi:hypothetical protein
LAQVVLLHLAVTPATEILLLAAVALEALLEF